ncbi:GPI-anchored protein LLG1 [Lolium perenne]|uniref:GPI-anchored protein LLG1 n=1 Tax=Lolium perenne TaxID=4522 RepID=UPI0021EAF8A9|nr:GPI-anchored protein LLG1-like [Lolium perenne]
MGLELDKVLMLRATVIAAVVGLAAAAGFISNDALHSHGAAGRSLLQTKKDCPVTFEGANYTLITSRCKGPLYQPALCCSALADFACPYGIYINDQSTNCAATMFSLIHLYGKYPSGLFANTCKGDKDGIKCPDDVPQVQPGQEGTNSAALATAAQAALVAAGAVAFSLFIVLS